MCGVRKLRKELDLMKVVEADKVPFMGDCEVTDWVQAPCTRECIGADGLGGMQNITREVVYVPTLKDGKKGKCPPLRIHRACNKKPCAQDCKMEPWGQWTQCTKSCGKLLFR